MGGDLFVPNPASNTPWLEGNVETNHCVSCFRSIGAGRMGSKCNDDPDYVTIALHRICNVGFQRRGPDFVFSIRGFRALEPKKCVFVVTF